jgi:hypothetical protein
MTGFENVGVFIREKVWLENSLSQESVPKRQQIKFRRRGITMKKKYNIQNTAKV